MELTLLTLRKLPWIMGMGLAQCAEGFKCEHRRVI